MSNPMKVPFRRSGVLRSSSLVRHARLSEFCIHLTDQGRDARPVFVVRIEQRSLSDGITLIQIEQADSAFGVLAPAPPLLEHLSGTIDGSASDSARVTGSHIEGSGKGPGALAVAR